MATRKEARRKSLIQFLTLLVAVCILIVTAVLAQKWFNARSATPPAEVEVKAIVLSQGGDAAGETTAVLPYMVCELGTECPEGEIPNLTLTADDTLKLEIPTEISNHQWQILTIYDDPAANDSTVHGPGETGEVEIPGSVAPIEASTGKTPKLQLVEISSIMVGTDATGEETPLNTVWSLSTMTAQELRTSKS